MKSLTKLAAILAAAESFLSGFEDDPLQEGIPELLADLRGAQEDLKVQENRRLASKQSADFGNEAELLLASGTRVRCPAYPEPCSYVRVLQDGLQVAYWNEQEWKDDPAEVMGAILGAAMGDNKLEPVLLNGGQAIQFVTRLARGWKVAVLNGGGAFQRHVRPLLDEATSLSRQWHELAREAPIYVVTTERDTYQPEPSSRPIVFETYTDTASLETAIAKQQQLGETYGKSRIARLVFIDQ